MDLELNKIAGTALGALLFTMALGIVSDAIYAPPAVSKPGYDLPAPAEQATGGQGTAAGAPTVPLPILLAKADAKKGEATSKPCTACHTFDKGGAAKVGPPLWGVVGRAKAAVAGFAYSDALKTKGGEWTFDDLDHFILNPKGYAPGTKMAFAGEKDPGRLADILAYLRSLSDNPAPLPQADASATPAAASPEDAASGRTPQGASPKSNAGPASPGSGHE